MTDAEYIAGLEYLIDQSAGILVLRLYRSDEVAALILAPSLTRDRQCDALALGNFLECNALSGDGRPQCLLCGYEFTFRGGRDTPVAFSVLRPRLETVSDGADVPVLVIGICARCECQHADLTEAIIGYIRRHLFPEVQVLRQVGAGHGIRI